MIYEKPIHCSIFQIDEPQSGSQWGRLINLANSQCVIYDLGSASPKKRANIYLFQNNCNRFMCERCMARKLTSFSNSKKTCLGRKKAHTVWRVPLMNPCGRYGRTKCSVEKWLEWLGEHFLSDIWLITIVRLSNGISANTFRAPVNISCVAVPLQFQSRKYILSKYACFPREQAVVRTCNACRKP